jgi:hypothetical protein
VKRNISIVDFVTDPQLLGLSISNATGNAAPGNLRLPLTKSMLKIWQRCTGREIYRISPNEVKDLKKRVASSRFPVFISKSFSRWKYYCRRRLTLARHK